MTDDKTTLMPTLTERTPLVNTPFPPRPWHRRIDAGGLTASAIMILLMTLAIAVTTDDVVSALLVGGLGVVLWLPLIAGVPQDTTVRERLFLVEQRRHRRRTGYDVSRAGVRR